MFETMGKAWVRRLKACVAAKGVFSSNTDMTDCIVPLTDTAQKYVIWHVM